MYFILMSEGLRLCFQPLPGLPGVDGGDENLVTTRKLGPDHNMPPRATVEEVYDDPDDLPLPSKALPNMGTRGALLEEITSDDEDDMEIPFEPTIVPRSAPSVASASSRSTFTAPGVPPGSKITTDKSQFKECACFGQCLDTN